MDQKITINCDLGEGIENEAYFFQFIDRASIACGGHFGDVETIYDSLTQAAQYQVACGAHPSYPDKENFGRKPMKMTTAKLKDSLCFQLEAFLQVNQRFSNTMDHIKPHGALYNAMMTDLKQAESLIYVREEFGLKCPIFVLCDSPFYEEFKDEIPLIQEAFIDRKYTRDKQLASRNLKGAVLEHIDQAVKQYIAFNQGNSITTIEGEDIQIYPQTACIHGDNPKALDILKEIKEQGDD